MIKGQKVSLCLPCRNEGSHLMEIITGIPDFIDEIIVISNNSRDDTVAIAKQIGGRVKVIEDNRILKGIGYGYAHMSGIAAATGDIIMGADGDGTYPVEMSDKVIEYLIDNEYDFISCNRYPVQPGTHDIPPLLQIGVQLFNWEIRLLYGIHIKDSLSGMWVFRKNITDKLNLTMGDWNLSPQIKINAARSHAIKFTEYSIVQHQRLGATKQRYLKTGLNHAWWIFTNRFKKQPKSA